MLSRIPRIGEADNQLFKLFKTRVTRNQFLVLRQSLTMRYQFIFLVNSYESSGGKMRTFPLCMLNPCIIRWLVRPTSLSQPKLMRVQKRHFFKIMLQRGVNNTHFQIVKPDRSSSLQFEIHPSLKHFWKKCLFQKLIHLG